MERNRQLGARKWRGGVSGLAILVLAPSAFGQSPREKEAASHPATTESQQPKAARTDEPPPFDPTREPSNPASFERELVFDATDHYAALEVRRGSQWRALCVAPCRVRAAFGSRLRVGGDGVRNSRPFTLPQSQAPLLIFARTGSTHVDEIGAFLVVLGGVGVVVGEAIGLSNLCFLCTPEQEQAQSSSERTGGIIVGLGAALVIGGVVTLVANKTHLEFRNGTVSREPSVHLAGGLELTGEGVRF